MYEYEHARIGPYASPTCLLHREMLFLGGSCCAGLLILGELSLRGAAQLREGGC